MPTIANARKPNPSLDGARDAQLADLLEYRLDTVVQVTLGILLARVSVQVLLNLGHAAVSLGAEAQLDLDQGFKRRVEIWHAQVDELGELGEELVVELLVGLLGEFSVLLGAWQLSGVLVGLLDETLDLSAHGVVVEEFVVALLDAFVDVGEVSAEAGYWLQDSGSVSSPEC